jgi:hypothetical protein
MRVKATGRGLLALGGALLLALSAAGQPPAPGMSTGWVCGLVVDETLSFVAEAELTVTLLTNGDQPAAAPWARVTADPHGAFCFQDLPPGFYHLRVAKLPWPPQPPRTVEVRAGLMNRLDPIELELEPGEPRVSYPDSIEGVTPGQARGLMERLLKQGDTASIQDLARRLLPKRGPRLDVNSLVMGLDTKPLQEELMRQLETGYLPPLKTARYIYLVGQLADSRTRPAAIQLLLRKLRDSRRLPANPYTVGETGETPYVSDEAMIALARLVGKDFKWQYGKPPVANTRAIDAAHTWWRQEVEREDSRRKPN